MAAAKFELRKDDPRKFMDQVRRSKRLDANQRWYEDYKENCALFANERAAWDSLGGYARRWRHRGTYVNLLRIIGESDTNRTVAKDPVWDAHPNVARTWFEVPGPNGIVRQYRDNREASHQVCEVLNFATKRAGLLEQSRRCHEDGFKAGFAYLKLGIPSAGDLSSTISYPHDTDDPNTSIPSGRMMHSGTLDRVPWVLRVPPQSIIEDPDATCWEEMNHLTHIIIRPFRDIMTDPRYKNGIDEARRRGIVMKPNLHAEDWKARSVLEGTEPENLEGYGRLHERHHRLFDPTAPDGFSYWITTLYECGGEPIVLRHGPYGRYVGGFTFTRYAPTQTNDQLKSVPPASLIKDQNGLLIYLMAMQTEWGVRNLPKWAVSNTAMTPQELNNLATSDLGMLIPIKGDGTNAVVPFPLIPIPDQLNMLVAMIRSSLDESAGQSPAQRLMPTGVSASENNEVAANARMYIQAKKNRVKAWFNETGLKYMRLLTSMLDPNGRWECRQRGGGHFEFDLMALAAADCELELNYKSTAEMDPVVERKLNQELAMILKQMEGPDFKLNTKAIAERIVVSADWSPEELMLKPVQQPWDPQIEHMKILSPVQQEPVKPNADEDFRVTIPVHREFAALVTKDPGLRQLWLTGQQGNKPFVRLMAHIKMSEDQAILKGMGKELGLQGPGRPSRATGFQRGSGPMAGRPTPGVPNTGDLMSHAGAVSVPGMGMGRGVQ